MSELSLAVQAWATYLTRQGQPPKLNLPATQTQIGAAQQALGVIFTPELQELYFLCNGSQGGFIAGEKMLSLDQMIQTQQGNKLDIEEDAVNLADNYNTVLYLSTPPDAITAHYWQMQWLPLCNENANYYCVDLAPGPAGTHGQIITSGRNESYDHTVIAPNLSEFFKLQLRLCQAGLIEFDEQGHFCTPEYGNGFGTLKWAMKQQ